MTKYPIYIIIYLEIVEIYFNFFNIKSMNRSSSHLQISNHQIERSLSKRRIYVNEETNKK
jgi:hypothetical protein